MVLYVFEEFGVVEGAHEVARGKSTSCSYDRPKLAVSVVKRKEAEPAFFGAV